METGRHISNSSRYTDRQTQRLPSIQASCQLHTPSIPGFRDICILNCGSSIFQFVKKYGNVFSVDFGIFRSVLITGLPLIKEALVHQDQNFANRPLIPIEKRIFNNKGKFLEQCMFAIPMVHERVSNNPKDQAHHIPAPLGS